ncbi:hypothetical protein [Marinobacterium litorale]|uniref:hypothetical protein n=1 Tax=Marinobacterium litorale TaxID=404770 RepID=UPI0004896E59|nr:hypothetical protein [Marinobacterium litorale]
MGRNGGTQMYCPSCGEIETCRAIGLRDLGEESGQRWYRTDHQDVHWFRRGRECLSCGHTFLTAEMNEQFLDELIELRDALVDIKKNAETYTAEANKASSSLNDLTKSLSVLKALKIYRDS